MAHVLVLAAHPDLRLSRVNRGLLEAARELAARPADGSTSTTRNTLELRDLYALYPDYVIDVPAEQASAARADLIVWQHPIQWYAAPPLMKLWFDEVLALGWAYGQNGTALRGKDVWLVASTGGTESAYRPDGYNRYFFDAFLPPYEQTAALCGLRFLPPLVLHGAHGMAAAQLAAHRAAYRDRLASYPGWPEMAELDDCPACEVPQGDRPEAVRP
ncbi:MAG: NAD(P)H-dependent oxidoreductase [Methylibium sp.]|jgi:glutathione-regulated potassium-efflux system ancillary protein KefF|uniref:glutathione-regulated potassium-efflux system oxidoreductase KefF n=1 Tax=unclassified Methylibium TaxID=2633235 RepID=UPI0006FF6E34|nr:NAD(P)H-dependent oxidoreductase [Methylibium sp. Root1272]KQW66789.1 NAD(P)H dehydrogenase [Methylibium sp. Root1272]MDP1791376.1 NAD(P)H-dependent oxidoreductase [Methylibium sp.]